MKLTPIKVLLHDGTIAEILGDAHEFRENGFHWLEVEQLFVDDKQRATRPKKGEKYTIIRSTMLVFNECMDGAWCWSNKDKAPTTNRPKPVPVEPSISKPVKLASLIDRAFDDFQLLPADPQP